MSATPLKTPTKTPTKTPAKVCATGSCPMKPLGIVGIVGIFVAILSLVACIFFFIKGNKQAALISVAGIVLGALVTIIGKPKKAKAE